MSDHDNYQDLAAFYDRITQESWGEVSKIIAQVLDGIPKRTRRAVDLACGTGRGSQLLVERGYAVIGIDRSEAMLEQARQNCPNAVFICGDITGPPELDPVDLVLCLGDSINHLLSEELWSRAMVGARRLLEPGGCFVFDVVTPHDQRNNWPTYAEVIDEANFTVASCSTYDPIEGIGRINDLLFVRSSDGHYTRHPIVHRELALSRVQITEMLRAAGFRSQRFRDGLDGGRATDRDVRWLVTAWS